MFLLWNRQLNPTMFRQLEAILCACTTEGLPLLHCNPVQNVVPITASATCIACEHSACTSSIRIHVLSRWCGCAVMNIQKIRWRHDWNSITESILVSLKLNWAVAIITDTVLAGPSAKLAIWNSFQGVWMSDLRQESQAVAEESSLC